MSFTKFHLVISKEEFLTAQKAGKFSGDVSPGLSLKRVDTDHEMFYLLMRIVGGPYGWHRRMEYHDATAHEELVEVLSQPDSRLWLFKWGHETVGFCCAANVEPSLVEIFQAKAGANEHAPTVSEIYKIGLFNEFTGHGWGRAFLGKVFAALFADCDAVYLNTRSTNHDKVVPFYESVGMRVAHAEECEDDLLPPNLSAPKLPRPEPGDS